MLIAARALALMGEHARQSGALECCGVLLGRWQPLTVEIAWPGHNRETARPHDRYTLDPLDIVAADRAAGERGLEIVGFYHSHPRGPASPSATDRRLAWPGYVYLIIPLAAGQSPRAWLAQAHGPCSELAIGELP